MSENHVNLSISLAKTPPKLTIRKLLFIASRKYMTPHRLRLWGSPGQRQSANLKLGVTEWRKSPGRVGARDAYATKTFSRIMNLSTI